ncbi:MAG: hypothetical protein P1V97_11340 [Planctomycetota bacterium]|nr:hypothetical protein [Planctomycetota bacterium]
MEKQRPQENPPEGQNPERDDVHLSANRCPYCHENVEISALDWVSCRSCQARHHKDCWSELGCCGSCKEERYLSDASETSRPQVTVPVNVAPVIDTNKKQRGFAKIMAGMMAAAMSVGVVLAMTEDVGFGGFELFILGFFTIALWSYAKSGIDPMGFGQPLGSKFKNDKDTQKNPDKAAK